MNHWPDVPESDTVDYRPRHAQGRPIDLDAPEVTYTPREPLDEIAFLTRSLTYGDMIELATALWNARGDKPVTLESMPNILHKWATESGHE